MTPQIHKSAARVQEALNQFGIPLKVVEMPGSTRTAQEAADAIGCTVSQIAKSLIFMGKSSKQPVLIIASGTNRVNEKGIKEILGEKLEKADAVFVLEHTGYAIGGIPPLGHKNPILTYIDQDLFQYEEIWAAAGTPNAVFQLTPKILAEITGGKVIQVT